MDDYFATNLSECETKLPTYDCSVIAIEMFDTMEKIAHDNATMILDDLREYVKYDVERYGLPDACIDEIYKEIIAKIAYASIKV